MARRGGKAANRRDRQRRAQRRAQQRPAPAQRQVSGALSEAVEAAADQRATAAPVAPATQLTRGARSDPRFAVAGPSRLGERAAADYHYVRSDLRNIAILVAIMAALLGAAVVVFGALGIGPN
jgi:hypothetical protein